MEMRLSPFRHPNNAQWANATTDDMLVTVLHEAMRSLGFDDTDMKDAAGSVGQFDAGLRAKCIH